MLNQKINFGKEIPVKYDVDILVVGGGPSGIAAAVTAAKQGAKVFVIEQHTCFGGMHTAGLVTVLGHLADGVNLLADGFGRTILENLVKEDAIGPDDKGKEFEKLSSFVAFQPEKLKIIYDRLIEESEVNYLFQTKLIDVIMEEKGNISHVICSSVGGMFAIKAKRFIDCTGNADLATLAKADFEINEDLQPGTLCSWAGIDWIKARELNASQSSKLAEAIKDGVFSVPDTHLPGMMATTSTTGGGNLGHIFGIDGTDEESLSKGYMHGRKLVEEYGTYYKKYLKGFEKMQLIETAPLMGIRETRRIIGEYRMVLDDFLNKRTFDDEIGRYNYPIDIHNSKPQSKGKATALVGMEKYRLPPGETYGISYRCLIPKKLKNVLVAGRCISCDRYILGSIRVVGGCYITGQAAGMAAAISVDSEKTIRKINIKALQQGLKKIGAYLPNC